MEQRGDLSPHAIVESPCVVGVDKAVAHPRGRFHALLDFGHHVERFFDALFWIDFSGFKRCVSRRAVEG